MSSLNVEHIKHENSSSNNVTLDSDGSVAFDTSTLYVDAVNNRVGVGTSNPLTKFHYTDSSTSGSIVKIENTSVGGGSWNLFSTGSANSEGAGKFLIHKDGGLGVTMQIDGSGNITTPFVPSFSVSYNGGTIADGNVILWNVTTNSGRFNNGNYYNPATGRFTAPVSGKYLFNMQLHHHQGAGTPPSHQYFDLRINGTAAYRFIGTWTVDNWYELNPSVVISLSANEYVDIFVFAAGSQWMGSNRPDHNRFSGFLIG